MANITTIPATAPFIDGLVKAILNGDLPQKGGKRPTPEQLAAMTLLLPTRRACRVCGEAFLRLSGKKSILLPKIRPLGDGNEDESLISEAINKVDSAENLINMNPAISKLERHLVLTRMIMSWLGKPARHKYTNPDMQETAGDKSQPATASLMAHELGKLIDNAETEAVDLKDLVNLVPEEFSEHWQQTLDFLKIITHEWPAYLENTSQMDVATRRNTLLEKEAERLTLTPPAGPVIIAGSTGSIPAAAMLMKAVLALGNGAIVLPALDQNLDDETFKTLESDHPEHPQFGLARLLKDLSEPRAGITQVPGTEPSAPEAALTRFLSEALRPSSSVEAWQSYAETVRAEKSNQKVLRTAFENISRYIARDDQEEAETIALILRRTADQKGRTAALVTPDRLLARRVATRLEAWDIKVDDSGGRPLAKTMPGAFFNLILDCHAKDYAPASFLALLKHPLTRLKFEKGDVRLAARALEIAALRLPWRGGGLGGIKALYEESANDKQQENRQHPAIGRLSDEEWKLAEAVLDRAIKAFAPLTQLAASNAPATLIEFLSAHIKVAENLAADSNETSEKLWQGAAGEQLAKILAEILSIESIAPKLTSRDYPDFYQSLLKGETVRPLTPVHPRLFIWGPYEARLQQPDVIILAGLNEGTWPSASKLSPWLSRPMCKDLGLPAPEQQTGHSAHDFASLLCAREVHITRAAKTAGVQTVPSRWLLRIEALLEGVGMKDLLEPKATEPFALWAEHRNQVTPYPSVNAPAPKPPLSARPRSLSVTRIEDWIANPYSIYARYILRLSPLDPIAGPPSVALKGQIIHEALERFSKSYPTTLPEDTESKLTAIAESIIKEWELHPEIAAFWQPRFAQFAAWFAATEPGRRLNVKQIWTEQTGRATYNTSHGPFVLTARADRIDALKDGTYHIYDYKTGTVPKPKQMHTHFKPQLPLEAAILQKGGFEELGRGPVSAVSYIDARGGEKGGDTTDLINGVDTVISETEASLIKLIEAFDNPETPYQALRRNDFKGHYIYDDYAHLARLEEWGLNDGEEV